jgi:hypothetical protein
MAAQRLRMGFAHSPNRVIIYLSLGALLCASLCKQVHGVTQAAVAAAADVRLFDLATLEAHWRCACNALRAPGKLVHVQKNLTRLCLHPAGSTRFAVLSISLPHGSQCRLPALSKASALGKRSMKVHA